MAAVKCYTNINNLEKLGITQPGINRHCHCHKTLYHAILFPKNTVFLDNFETGKWLLVVINSNL